MQASISITSNTLGNLKLKPSFRAFIMSRSTHKVLVELKLCLLQDLRCWKLRDFGSDME